MGLRSFPQKCRAEVALRAGVRKWPEAEMPSGPLLRRY
jgi:hypothetical protein